MSQGHRRNPGSQPGAGGRWRWRWLAAVLPAALLAAFALTAPASAAPPPAATPTTSPAPAASSSRPTLTSAPAPRHAEATHPGAQKPSARGRAAAPASPSSPSAGSAAKSALRSRIASIALGQIGRGDSPVVTDFSGLNCNPYSTMVAGFSSNSNDCGYDSTFGVRNSNENWCADFVKWVWSQAGVTQDMNTLNAAASSFYQWALDDGQQPRAGTGTAQVGDAVVFFGAGAISASRYADHVGIVSAVNPDGTIDMVNGDFSSSTNIKVEHDTGISLPAFAATWSAGEQWVLVAPPAAVQHPAPRGTLRGATTAVTGADAVFSARASQRGGSVTGYYWMFGDGRTTNATGPEATHVFTTPGTYTVSVTTTSSLGTTSTLTRNVTVLAGSRAVASVPSSQVWYSAYPVSSYRFVRSGSGLAADIWDGASWLQVPTAGTPSPTGSIAALAYPDAEADSATVPHAFYRDASGGLAVTSRIDGAWRSQTLPGRPAAGADVVAAVTAEGPAVYFVDGHGRLDQTSLAGGAWSTHVLPVRASAASLALTQTADGPVIVTAGPGGRLTAVEQTGRGWRAIPLPVRAGSGVTITAFTTPTGRASVVANDAVGARGRLVQLTEGAWGLWTASPLPGNPARGSAVVATTYLGPAATSGSLGDFVQPPGTLKASGPRQPLETAVAYLTRGGTPAVSHTSGGRWRTTDLPGTATSLEGVDAVATAHVPIQVFLRTGSGPVVDSTGDTSLTGHWTAAQPPSRPATFADRVLIYGGTDADIASAKAAASAAGLPAAQVTSSFAVAWAAVLSGDHLVITSGAAATSALEYNVCGWADPSAADGGSTPFDYVTAPRTTLPGADLFLNGSSSSDGPQRVASLTYYALHGELPAGQASVPASAPPARVCSGSGS